MPRSRRTKAPETRKDGVSPLGSATTDGSANDDPPPGDGFSPQERKSLYAAAKYLPSPVERKCGLQIPFEVYLQDPLLAKMQPTNAFDKEFFVNWEPGLTDGPTSARFAVVDYNGDTGHLAPPAHWDEKRQKFVFGDQVLDERTTETLQFHQVNTWVLVQRTLAFFEEGSGLGRPIPWGFEGNRLIIVPHAGYGQNAFYDRNSKSLQFYYFGSEDDTVYTCLSTDIVCHEFGHAVLDGVRPYYSESSLIQTAAFHEAIGDITAILMSLRNNAFRQWLAEITGGNLSSENPLAFIGEQFGKAVSDKPYLRSALNRSKMSEFAPSAEPHQVSEVLTGAIFDILINLAKQYMEVRGRTTLEAFWDVAARMQRTVVQPLDLLPPVDVTFRDYALAVIRAEQLANPLDPYKYRDVMIEIFRRREILTTEDEEELKQQEYLVERQRLSVFHAIDDISRSRAAAYKFLNDNRDDLFIPASHDFVIADLYDAHKLTRQATRLPRQVILEYVWREEIPLVGPRFGRFDGHLTTMLCGGTLVFDDSGNVLSWTRKPGTGSKIDKKGQIDKRWLGEVSIGQKRRGEFLDAIAAQIAAGRVGAISGSQRGLLGSRIPPITAEDEDGTLQFRLSPHLDLSEDDQIREADDLGERQWEISC
jgi:hypothetical protein